MTALRPPDLPARAAWTLEGDRRGFEAVDLRRTADGWTFLGATTALEGDLAWHVSYDIAVDARGTTRRAAVSSRRGAGSRSTVLEHDGAGRWTVDGRRAPLLDGCLDVDLESSALTNALPVRRLGPSLLRSAEAVQVPAAYVRVGGEVERLEQSYRGLDADPVAVDYRAPAFDFACRITYDAAGLVVHYPAIAARVA